MTSAADPLVHRAARWLADFESALAERDKAQLTGLFAPESYWRDLLALTWDARQYHSREELVDELVTQAPWAKPKQFKLDQGRRPPMVNDVLGNAVVEFSFVFETTVGTARGYLTALATEGEGPLAGFVLFTQLAEISGGEAMTPGARHPGHGYEPQWPGQTWGQYRAARSGYADREPDVLVVGGGQSGVSIAALLGQLDVDTLVVDRYERAGDSWRKRYEALALHTPTDMMDFPYLPMPKTFPQYIPKDLYADYIEAYVKLMNLNYWTSTEFLGAEFDEDSMTWTARVRQDGSVRTLRPKHLVVTVGGTGRRANQPPLPGLESFDGVTVHSSRFHAGADHRGTRAMVIGVGTSAHDIALDLYRNGCDVRMVQRGSTTVVDLEVANKAYADYTDPAVPQPEADTRTAAKAVYPLQVKTLLRYTEWTNAVSEELLTGLERAGMKLDVGEDGTGWLMKFLRYAGGYYLNVGASNAIVDGGIKVLQYDEIDRFVPDGVRLKSGEQLDLDLVVLATGYQHLTVDVEEFFGAEVARRVGEVSGIGPDGERRNFCRPTAQPHLWFMYGGIAHVRQSAPWLTLQIKGNLMGIVPSYVRTDDLKAKPFRVQPPWFQPDRATYPSDQPIPPATVAG